MVERESSLRGIQTSIKEMERATQFGGVDKDWKDYTKKDNLIYCDKGGHKERSIYHAPQHLEHWRKAEYGERD